jgi:hypothetical protein
MIATPVMPRQVVIQAGVHWFSPRCRGDWAVRGVYSSSLQTGHLPSPASSNKWSYTENTGGSSLTSGSKIGSGEGVAVEQLLSSHARTPFVESGDK